MTTRRIVVDHVLFVVTSRPAAGCTRPPSHPSDIRSSTSRRTASTTGSRDSTTSPSIRALR
jgi:hypothetical protein